MNRLFVSIWFPYLLTDWFAKKDGSLANKAFVCTIQQRNRMMVKAANAIAAKAGITAGMTLADARALSPGLFSMEAEAGLENKLLSAMARYCVRFTPTTAVDQQDGLLLEASGCCHLWKDEKNYLRVIHERFTALGYSIQIAMAPSIGAAWGLARFKNGEVVLEVKELPLLLQTLPAAALRIDEETIHKLQKAGLYKLSLFMNMPAAALRRRFGQTLITRLSQALGNEAEWIDPIEPVAEYLEQLPCLEPVFTAVAIEIAIQQLLEKLCNRLKKEQKGLRHATLSCYRIDHKKIDISIGTGSPSANPIHLFKLFQLKIETISPGFGIELFTLSAGKVQESKPKQELFWRLPSSGIDQELSELIDRVRLKLPAIKITRFEAKEHYWPERSFAAEPDIQQSLDTPWNPTRPRPLCLLNPPQQIMVTAPVPDYPPLNFRHKGKLHKIMKADGPERIEPEWWIDEGMHRDYYYVEDEEGQRYWLFRSGHYNGLRNEQWYLQGFFA